jgi:hypothetical protein
LAIDPPLGFAQRVMAHVRDIEPKPSLWQRLILPLTSRVPVRATALAAVAIVAIALYQKEQPLKQNSDVNLALRNDAPTQVKEKDPTLSSAAPIAAPKIAQSVMKARQQGSNASRQGSRHGHRLKLCHPCQRNPHKQQPRRR